MLEPDANLVDGSELDGVAIADLVGGDVDGLPVAVEAGLERDIGALAAVVDDGELARVVGGAFGFAHEAVLVDGDGLAWPENQSAVALERRYDAYRI